MGKEGVAIPELHLNLGLGLHQILSYMWGKLKMPPHQRARSPLKERPIAEKPFERVEIDTKGPLRRTDKGSQFILGCIFQICGIVPIAMTDNRRSKLQDSRMDW